MGLQLYDFIMLDGITQMSLELLAFIASSFGVCGSLPQILKILRTKDTAALSLTTQFMLGFSSLLWVAYGAFAHVYAIMFWNSIASLMAASVVYLKLKNERDHYLRLLHDFLAHRLPARAIPEQDSP